MFVNFGYVGGESAVGGYRVISGRERKRTQVLRDFSRGTAAIFVNVYRVYRVLSSFYRQPHTHERHPTDTRRLKGRHTEEHVYLTTLTRKPADRVPICIFYPI